MAARVKPAEPVDGWRRRPGEKWTRLLPDEGVYLKYAGPDDVKGEWDNKQDGRTLTEITR